jgi:aryl-alcohol dehydrogenase-like predicted oxidoreductase
MESAHKAAPSLPFDALGRDVSRLVLGTMLLAESGTEALDEYVRLGGNAIDTARVYGDGEAERVLGEWLVERPGVRERLVIVSKGAHPSGERKRVTPEEIERDLRTSVELLGGPVDVYLLHRDDPSVPVGTIVESLGALREAGLLRAYGTSNWTTPRIDEANAWAAANGVPGFCMSSQHLSLAVQNEEQWPDTRSAADPEVFAWHERTQTPLLAWSVQARGYFFGRDGSEVLRVYDNAVNRERRLRAKRLGEPLGFTASQVALAWALEQPFPVFACFGARDAAQVREAFGALDVDPGELAGLTA